MSGDLLQRYDKGLPRSCRNLPENAARPSPSSLWPEENICLYQKYQDWLLGGGAGAYSARNVYLPVAGHILGLNLVPYQRMELEKDFEKVLDFVTTRGASPHRLRMARLGMERFRKFVRIQLGLGESPRFKPFDLNRYTQGLPPWLAIELERYQRILQRNWRPARVMANLSSFWSKHGKLWRFFREGQGVVQLADLKRRHILAFIDQCLEDGYAASTINCYILYLRSFLGFLQQEGYEVPQVLLRVKTLKTPDSLPKYLNDEQVIQLRDTIRCSLREARDFPQRRQALLDQALFYLLWQGGLRLSEVEELRLEDLDLPGQRLSVKQGKGKKDRTVFLTRVTISVLRAYLQVRGDGSSEHVFLYRNAPLNKSFIGSRLKTLGEKTGVRVYAHRLRHTTATQLLNAGCRVTSIQKILGHENINTTMIYARAYNQTVADDFYAAMDRVEQRLEILLVEQEDVEEENEVVNVQPVLETGDRARVLSWIERLARDDLTISDRLFIAASLKQVLFSAGVPPG